MLAMGDAFGLEVTGEAGILAAILEEYPSAVYRATIVADAGLAIGNAKHYPTLLTPRGAAYGGYLGGYGIGTHGIGAQLGDVGCDAAKPIVTATILASVAIDTGYVEFLGVGTRARSYGDGNLGCLA